MKKVIEIDSNYSNSSKSWTHDLVCLGLPESSRTIVSYLVRICKCGIKHSIEYFTLPWLLIQSIYMLPVLKNILNKFAHCSLLQVPNVNCFTIGFVVLRYSIILKFRQLANFYQIYFSISVQFQLEMTIQCEYKSFLLILI